MCECVFFFFPSFFSFSIYCLSERGKGFAFGEQLRIREVDEETMIFSTLSKPPVGIYKARKRESSALGPNGAIYVTRIVPTSALYANDGGRVRVSIEPPSPGGVPRMWNPRVCCLAQDPLRRSGCDRTTGKLFYPMKTPEHP